MDSNGKSNRSRWSSQFGLYRYQSASPTNLKPNHIFSGLLGFVGLVCIVVFVTLFLTINRFNSTQHSIAIPDVIASEESSDPAQHSTTTTVSYSEVIDYIDEELDDDSEIYEENGLIFKRKTDNGTTEYIESEEPQESESLEGALSEKLILSASHHHQYGKNAKFHPKRTWRRRVSPPRPFDHQLSGPKPLSFQKSKRNHAGLTTYIHPVYPHAGHSHQINNIQDILNQAEINTQIMTNPVSMGSNSHGSRIEFRGTYRHPKEYREMMNIFSPEQSRIKSVSQHPPSDQGKFVSDPFHNYKPKSPSDINLMALNQVRFAPSPRLRPQGLIPIRSGVRRPKYYDDEQVAMKVEGDTEYERSSQVDRSSNQKPFSLMLDIYPMQEKEKARRPAHYRSESVPNVDAINSLQHSPDLSYFNTINFPQLQPVRHPLAPNLYTSVMGRIPVVAIGQSSMNYPSLYETHESSENEKPSKMIVHLNLFPKTQQRRHKQRNVKIIEDRTAYDVDPREMDLVTVTKEPTTTPPPTISPTLGQIIVSTFLSPFSNSSNAYDGSENMDVFEVAKEINTKLNFDDDFGSISAEAKLGEDEFPTIPPNHRPDQFFQPNSEDILKFSSGDVVRKSSERNLFGELNLNEELIL